MAQYQSYFPKSFGRYHEPFVGGGACFFHLQPQDAVLCDINSRLVDTYSSIRDDIYGLLELLKEHRQKHGKDYYYQCRERFNQGHLLSQTERGALMIYLNKTCFNGLYRENSKGKFNVPIGRYKSPKVFDAENLHGVHRMLQGVELLEDSFEGVLDRAEAGDLIFFDPPYIPLSATSSFTTYSKGGFGYEEHRRLAEVFGELAERGCHVMLSNSDCEPVRELYKDWRIIDISAARCINSRASSRGAVGEVLVLGQ